MAKLILMQGLPASGKSTKARQLVRQLGNGLRINRDDLRNMMFDGVWSAKREDQVRETELQMAGLAIANGLVPIIDDTNLSRSAINMWTKMARDFKLEIQWEQMHTDIETCIARDKLRQGGERVGRAVIERMALWNGLIEFGDKPIVLFDIDGTLANGDHRLSHVSGDGKKDWKTYYSLCHMDAPYEVLVKWAKHIVQGEYGPQYQLIVVSGRPVSFNGEIPTGMMTVAWLDGQGIPYKHLFMRASHDSREDSIIKEEILEKILAKVPKEQIAFVVDDRPRVIRMWQKHGLRVIPARGTCEEF